jgi:acyl-CoA thioesterase-1
MKCTKTALLAATILLTAAAGAGAQTIPTTLRWACIGNSITQGNGGTNTYPSRLAARLGAGYTVSNYGIGWRTMLRSGDSTYWKYGRLAQVFAARPDIISISLGTNDSKPINWNDDSASFIKDYRDMVDTLLTIVPTPKIILLYPTPVWKNESGTQQSDVIRQSVIRGSIIPKIRQIAIEKGLDTIDLHTPFLNRQSLFPDSIHPGNAGYDTLSAHIYRAYVARRTRIAAIGNSITQYVNTGVANANAVDAWPVRLNMRLGRDFFVQNYGVSGFYMLKPNPAISDLNSYWSTDRLGLIFAFKPQVVTIMLGTNDSRPRAWNTEKYIADYKAMIDTLSNNISPKPQIWLMRPLPAWKVGGAWGFSTPSGTTNNGINGNTIRDSVVPAVIAVAAAKGLQTIDMYSAFYADSNSMPSIVVDGVHVNKAGQDSIAAVVYGAIKASVSIKPQAGRAIAARATAKARLVPILFPTEASMAGTTRMFTLDGKSMARSAQSGKGIAAGIYLAKPKTESPTR